jgi:hypothetical protein
MTYPVVDMRVTFGDFTLDTGTRLQGAPPVSELVRR